MFIKKPEDIVVPVIRMNDRYVSLDGHTRLYLAHKKRWKKVRAVISCTDDWILQFVEEAKKTMYLLSMRFAVGITRRI